MKITTLGGDQAAAIFQQVVGVSRMAMSVKEVQEPSSP
jgi:hypothetical protein